MDSKFYFVNRYIDQDWLCTIAKQKDNNSNIQGDNYKEVIDYFERWIGKLKSII